MKDISSGDNVYVTSDPSPAYLSNEEVKASSIRLKELALRGESVIIYLE